MTMDAYGTDVKLTLLITCNLFVLIYSLDRYLNRLFTCVVLNSGCNKIVCGNWQSSTLSVPTITNYIHYDSYNPVACWNMSQVYKYIFATK